jgi:hypothetical protein
MKSIFLDLILQPFPHTSEALYKCIWENITEWGITNKIISITTDGAANMIATVKLLVDNEGVLFHNRCAAHAIQLIVNKGLSILKKTDSETEKEEMLIEERNESRQPSNIIEKIR